LGERHDEHRFSHSGEACMIEIPGFAIGGEIGRGGMATVYLAQQLSLQRAVALKVLDPKLAASDPGFAQRFLREGRIAASLHHRHILAIHDVGVHQGQAYLALEYVPGGSIAGFAGRMSPREALRLVREIASALALAHANGVIHRDIKPENILRQADGGFVLADFGIARMLGSEPLTGEGVCAGTPAYMAPEQWGQQPIDGRADFYSLGIVLYQMLSGRVPYAGDDGWAIGMQHLQAPLPRLPAECAVLQPLLARMLAKNKESRFADADELIACVVAFEQRPEFAIAAPAGSDPIEHLQRRPLALAALLLPPPTSLIWRRLLPAVVGVLVLLAIAIMSWRAMHGRAQWDRLLGDTRTLATVAVLPCESYTDSADQRLLGEVLAEELIHRLSRLRGLTVIARSSSFPLRTSGLDAAAIGARLGASHLLACTIRPAGDGVRIFTELVETSTGAQRWSAEYDRPGEQLLNVVDELAIGISERLLLHLAGPERARLIQHRTESIEAIRLVEQGRASARQLTLAGIDRGRELIREAIAIDPGYALAQVALADVYQAQMQRQQHDADWWQRQVQPLLARALELDPELPAALVLRSQLRCAQYDWKGCRTDIEQALRDEPGSADVRAGAAAYHAYLGSRAQAVEHALRLVQIEPELARSWDTLTQTLIQAGRLDEALTSTERSLQRFPQHWPTLRNRAQTLELLGRCDDGIAAHERALALSDAAQELNSTVASLYRCAGRLDRAQTLLRELQLQRASGDKVSDMAFATTFLALGQKDAALDAMEAMLGAADPRLWQWLVSPRFGIQQLAGEPRFLALLERLHLPPDAMRWKPQAP